MSRNDFVAAQVERWLNGNLEGVANDLLTRNHGFLVDFITLLIKERHATNHGMGTAIKTEPLSFDGWQDLARLSEMLR